MQISLFYSISSVRWWCSGKAKDIVEACCRGPRKSKEPLDLSEISVTFFGAIPYEKLHNSLYLLPFEEVLPINQLFNSSSLAKDCTRYIICDL